MADLRVLLVDDHEVVRMGLRLVLEDTPGVRLVAEAGNADEAIACCQRLQPDVVVMDIRLPGRSGIQTCREITVKWPQMRVVMLSSFIDDDLLAEAIDAGASAYVTKNVGTGELVRALEAVRQGGAAFDPAITQRVLDMVRRRSQRGNPFAGLTKRELLVLHLLSLGKSNSQIADEMVLSDKTVRNHVSTLLSKLNLENRVEAATFALHKRVVDYLPQDE